MWKKSYCLLLLIWLFTIVNSSILEEDDAFGKTCVLGKVFYDGCNWCYCGTKGMACEMISCYDPETREGKIPQKAPPDFWHHN